MWNKIEVKIALKLENRKIAQCGVASGEVHTQGADVTCTWKQASEVFGRNRRQVRFFDTAALYFDTARVQVGAEGPIEFQEVVLEWTRCCNHDN